MHAKYEKQKKERSFNEYLIEFKYSLIDQNPERKLNAIRINEKPKKYLNGNFLFKLKNTSGTSARINILNGDVEFIPLFKASYN